MRMKTFLIAICASLLLAACGGAGTGISGPGKLTFKFKMMGNDVTKDLTVKQGSVFVNDIIPKTGSSVRIMDNFINLANYDFDPKKASEAYPKKDGDILIVIQVLGDKDATEKTPLKAGDYPASQAADGENVFGKAWHMQIRYFEEGKIKEAYIDASYPKGTRKGSVKINPISGDTFSGEVDMSDDFGSLKGTFTGKLEPKP